jgi:type I restriction enzyme, S subunit
LLIRTNLASINSGDLRGLPFPVPPLETQQTLVAAIAAARQRAAGLRAEADRLQTAAIAEAEAAILGKGAGWTQAGGHPE